MPTLLRISASPASSIEVTSPPRTDTLPCDGLINPAIVLSRTLFPLAPGPISAYTQPSGTCRLTPCSTSFSPNETWTSATSINSDAAHRRRLRDATDAEHIRRHAQRDRS